MKKTLVMFLLVACGAPAMAQQLLSLDSCRAMAIRNNKQMGITQQKKVMAHYTTKAARTQYLPKLNVVGGYMFTSREISLLSKEQKTTLSNIGTALSGSIGEDISSVIAAMTRDGVFTPSQAEHIGAVLGNMGTNVGGAINGVGQNVVNALHTDTRNMFMASAVVTQPIYMGGAISAANKMASISEQMVANDYEAKLQATLHGTDHAYWMVVSLKHKRKLADSYLKLVKKLSNDVHKMIDEGVATRADGLKVDVKVNEAEMTLTQADNGLSLAKMFLCQLCGLPLDSKITLADEDRESLPIEVVADDIDINTVADNRPEVKLLENTVDLSRQATRLARASYLPQILLSGGYSATNPNLYNGFERKFSGAWNVGVVVRMPVWNWFEGVYKVRASKAATCIAQLEVGDVREKIELQVSQSRFKMSEANRRLVMATSNVDKANENLRCANLGFREGVIPSTGVMEAQTAWLQAQSQKIDAEIDVKLSQVDYKKALGTLQ
ncbi:MAG: TolC family protein [Prevotellaceae bacterium]|nr:TolC family protein [Prevotellaceae bacterium]